MIGASALSQIALATVGARARLVAGLASMVTGLALVALAAHELSLLLFVVAGVVAGAGVGLVFQSAIAVAVRVSSDSNRSGTVAGMFLAAYTGITAPVIAVGVLLTVVSAPVVLECFAVVVALVVALATVRLLRTDVG